MPIPIQSCLQHIKHTLGGGLPDDIEPLAIINEAGRNLVTLHPWKWLYRPPVTLGQVSGQSWIALPSDFGGIISLEFTIGLTHFVVQTTLNQIQNYRANLITVPAYTLYAAVIYTEDPTTGASTPRLEIFPTPGSTDASAIQLIYRATWVDITNTDTDVTITPDWMDPILLQLIRAVARGFHSEDQGSMSQRLTDVMSSPLWRKAVERDADTQNEFGPLRHGWMTHTTRHWPWTLRTTVGPPGV